jgi:hypothetical protein
VGGALPISLSDAAHVIGCFRRVAGDALDNQVLQAVVATKGARQLVVVSELPDLKRQAANLALALRSAEALGLGLFGELLTGGHSTSIPPRSIPQTVQR